LIKIKSKKDYNKLKELSNKFVKLKGYIKFEKEVIIELPRWTSKLTINKVIEIPLASLGIKTNFQKELISEVNFYLLNKYNQKGSSTGGITIEDSTANTIIAGAGTALGIILGPISLIPASIFGLTTLMSDE
jgi:hypothetical protein